MSTRTARFDLRIYTAETIYQATEAFSDFGAFTSTTDGDHVVVQAEIDEKAARQVWGEFQNYILVNS